LLVEFLAAGLTGLFQALDELIVLPSYLVCELPKVAEFAAGFERLDGEGTRDDHALFLVKWCRDALEYLQALKGRGASLRLVGDHAADSSPEDTAGCTVVKRTTAARVCVVLLLHELKPLELITII